MTQGYKLTADWESRYFCTIFEMSITKFVCLFVCFGGGEVIEKEKGKKSSQEVLLPSPEKDAVGREEAENLLGV
jgi:hypothetical protein